MSWKYVEIRCSRGNTDWSMARSVSAPSLPRTLVSMRCKPSQARTTRARSAPLLHEPRRRLTVSVGTHFRWLTPSPFLCRILNQHLCS